MLKSLQYANLGRAFLLEIGALAALYFWGFAVGDSALLKIILGVGAPMLMIIVWGWLLAPLRHDDLKIQRCSCSNSLYSAQRHSVWSSLTRLSWAAH